MTQAARVRHDFYHQQEILQEATARRPAKDLTATMLVLLMKYTCSIATVGTCV